MVDRAAFDRIQQQGGFTTVNVGSAPDGNAILVPKEAADNAMDAAQLHRLRGLRGRLPQRLGFAVRQRQDQPVLVAAAGRARAHAAGPGDDRQMDEEGFGDCSNHGECEAVCPKEISIQNIARMRREYIRAAFKG